MVARRALVLLCAVAATLAAMSPAFADTENPEVEGTNWYWRSQERRALSDITGGCPEGTPVCPDPLLGLPNTHDAGSLPVMVLNGEIEKISAIKFDLDDIIPPQGAEISKFTFTIIESQSPRDRSQQFNDEGREIQACFIEDFWPSSEDKADQMKDAPPYECADAPKGERNPDADPPTWTFDISQIAAEWGEDPFANNGVMLVPVTTGEGGAAETWQIVLRGTVRDIAETPMNEEEENANNVQSSIEFTPNPEPDVAPPVIPPTDDGFATDGDFGFGDTGADTGAPPAPETAPPPADTGDEVVAEPEPVSENLPTTPGYIWLVIPAGLLALALVRSTVMEPPPGKREDGVVARIRTQNQARRGGPTTEAAGRSTLAAVGHAFREGARKLAFWRK